MAIAARELERPQDPSVAGSSGEKLRIPLLPAKFLKWDGYHQGLIDDLLGVGLVARDVVVHTVDQLSPATAKWLIDAVKPASLAFCLEQVQNAKKLEKPEFDPVSRFWLKSGVYRAYKGFLGFELPQLDEDDPLVGKFGRLLTDNFVGAYEYQMHSGYTPKAEMASRLVGRMQRGIGLLGFINYNFHILALSVNLPVTTGPTAT